MTTSRIGRGAIVTLGAAASLAGAAGAANACDKQPPPNNNCTVDSHDVQYAPASQDGKGIVGQWRDARGQSYKSLQAEPQFGIKVRLNPDLVDASCKGSIDVSLASYTAEGKTWESSGTQTFVDHTQTIPSLSAAHPEETLTVKLPGSTGGPCFGQIDLYFGTKVYDGQPGNGALPHYSQDKKTWTPAQGDMITNWNGADVAGTCGVTPPTTTPSTPTTTPSTPTTTPSTPTTTSPTTHPSTPASSTPTTPTPSSSTGTPSTPPTTTATPGTPTLAHTGANVGEVSLVALAFFGAGGTAMFASRKAKAAGARKH
jgi:hypothetical protein